MVASDEDTTPTYALDALAANLSIDVTPVGNIGGDAEQEFGLTEGNIFHGELSLEQLFFLRPAPKWARYRTPIKKLWMCGSGAHPGGGVMGAPGRLAALQMLKESAV